MESHSEVGAVRGHAYQLVLSQCCVALAFREEAGAARWLSADRPAHWQPHSAIATFQVIWAQ
jgi:hypothetical protein